MLTLDQIKKRLEYANIQELSKNAGVHPNTLYSIRNGRIPSYATVKKVSDYFIAIESTDAQDNAQQ